MTTSNSPSSVENRLDQIEQLLAVFAQQARERDTAAHVRMDQLAAQMAQRDAAVNAQIAQRDAAAHVRMDELAAQMAHRDAIAHARMDQLTQAVDNLTASMVELREGQALIIQIFREEQDKREETRQEIRAMQSQIMGLQTENRRTLERLEQRDRDQDR